MRPLLTDLINKTDDMMKGEHRQEHKVCLACDDMNVQQRDVNIQAALFELVRDKWRID